MVTTLTDAKRTAIAEKLAGMRAIQNLIINNEHQFLQDCRDEKVRSRVQDMLEDDEKNLKILETSIIQYGIQSEPKQTVKQLVEHVGQMMQGSDLSLYEKLSQHELLKHGQVMSGLLVHKAGQVVGADIEAAIAPLNTVNFETRAHQEQLKGLLEYVGTQELTGQEPDQSIWGRVQDAMAAMTGVLGSAKTQASDNENADIMSLIFMDHQKAKTLIREIKNASSSQKSEEYFGQLYQDLIVHSKAEEQAVYPKIRSFYGEGDTQELYDDQAEMESVLNQMKSLSPQSDEFSACLQQLRDMVGHHTSEEENHVFPAMRKNMSPEQREQMGAQFKEAKKQLQTEMASQM
ncbi:hemerythrin domain-containing protein [Pseudanabaena sp. FACHB-2040]|uniref:hemerythrin domain-containing protein n=1 Tax=Pseudanabaena sp. FACHB-2040 TaxID=2692859 RepID=UPI001683314E|nr:hemerythrin domain-containing protein [Pseudanabaena sp. FACHB-2040]MBD2258847.1 hemerythrin domain-containing protein [Pseudanabaena sp. FACHB-2040]